MALHSDDEDDRIRSAEPTPSGSGSNPQSINDIDMTDEPHSQEPNQTLEEDDDHPLPNDLFDKDDPEEDSVLYTLPIYASHSLSPHLQLFQYPLHHRSPALSAWSQQNHQRITARFKEKVGRFELEVPVDGRSAVWSDERAEEMGFVEQEEEEKRKGKGRSNEVSSSASNMKNWGTKVRLRSEEIPSVAGYWTGMVHDGALHLQPVSSHLQLRPSLGYLDVAETAMRARKEAERRVMAGENIEQILEEEDGTSGGTDGNGNGNAQGGKKGNGKEEDGFMAVISQAQRDTSDDLERRRTKMGTAGTVGMTGSIRNSIVAKIFQENLDPWVEWEWVDDPDETDDVLNNLLVPKNRRAMLKCKTKALDMISTDCIGTGARLPEGNDWLKVDRVGPGGVVKRE